MTMENESYLLYVNIKNKWSEKKIHKNRTKKKNGIPILVYGVWYTYTYIVPIFNRY